MRGQLKFLNKYFEVIAVSGAGADLDEVAEREGVSVIPLSMERQISLLQDLRSFISLFLLFRKTKPMLVHSITPKAGLLSMAAAYFAGVPVRMHTFTGLIFPTHSGNYQRLLIAMDKLLCFFASNIYPEGEGVKKDLIRFNITGKPLKVLANGNVNGVDVSHFNPENFDAQQKLELRQSVGLMETDFVFVYVGRLVGDKGVNELIEAFRILNANNPGTRLLIIGSAEGESDPLKQQTIDQIERNPAINLIGFQSDIRPYLSIAQALVLASYREGFPNVVLQGGAMGLPCLVTDINGSNEIIKHGENGLIVPVKDVERTRDAMALLVKDIDLYQRLKAKARGLIVSRYDQRLVWQAVLEEYNLLLRNEAKQR